MTPLTSPIFFCLDIYILWLSVTIARRYSVTVDTQTGIFTAVVRHRATRVFWPPCTLWTTERHSWAAWFFKCEDPSDSVVPHERSRSYFFSLFQDKNMTCVCATNYDAVCGPFAASPMNRSTCTSCLCAKGTRARFQKSSKNSSGRAPVSFREKMKRNRVQESIALSLFCCICFTRRFTYWWKSKIRSVPTAVFRESKLL